MRRTKGLRSRPRPKPSIERVLARDFRDAVLAKGSCRMCGGRPDDPHHVVYQQHLRYDGHPLWDPRDGIPLCRRCHDAHHNGSNRIPVGKLAVENFEFAFEHLGEYAYDYLQRRYVDPEHLLETYRSAA